MDGHGIRAELGRLVGGEHVLEAPAGSPYNSDASGRRGLEGRAEAVILPGSAEEVAAVLAWCYEHDVPLVTRGGGTGLVGGAVPTPGSIVCSLERLRRVRELEPGLWRMFVEAGVRTRDVQRLARENGLLFGPDPGAAEQSQIGGNVATNAGGPHALKYGVTGAWVSGLEVALAPGELADVGGWIRKDVAGYDIKDLMIGSEGTLGIVTAVRLRLLPAPARTLALVAFARSRAEGCEAVLRVFAAGLRPSVLDFLDAQTLALAGGAYPDALPEWAQFALIVELDGSEEEVEAQRREAVELLADLAPDLQQPADEQALWRWRDGINPAVTGVRGAKVSADVVLPVERLRETLDAFDAIASRHGLESCSWGHAGEGNLHATVIVDPASDAELDAAEAVMDELYELVATSGGSIAGEHGVGLLKRGRLARQWSPRAVELHERIKRAFDPKDLLNGVEVQRNSDRFLVGQNSPDRVMALGDNTYDPGDLKALRASVQSTLSPNAESAFITGIKHAEGLTPNLFERYGLASIDGYDGGILPLARYDDFKKLFPLQGSDPSDGRLRLQLVSAPNPGLLGWLNVRYLLMDRLRDRWIGGVYYDLAVSADLPPDHSVTLSTDSPFSFDRLGVILGGTSSGPPIGDLTLRAGTTSLHLDLNDPRIRQAGQFVQDDFDPNGAWLWTLDAPRPDSLNQVTVSWSGPEPTTLRSLSAIDTGQRADRTITTSSAYRVAFLEDMKIYVNRDVLPRAFLARGVEVVPNLADAVDRMGQAGWDPQATAVAVSGDVPPSLAFTATGDPGTTEMVLEGNQRVVVDTQTTGPRLLVLTDSYYPGWRATIDGQTVPIYEVNLMFRGVVVPAGAHQVVFTYQPMSWKIGLAGSALGIVLLLLGFRLSHPRPPDPAP